MKLSSFISIILISWICMTGHTRAEEGFVQARSAMVEYQIRDRGIKDPRVLSAMESVPRHAFVPEKQQGAAYRDRPLPIGYGQTISQPYIVALMTELLALEDGDRVLEVGTGSGYQAAVLAEIVSRVYTVEIVRPLHERSAETLEGLGYGNISTANLDGYYGWAEHGPYDAVIVTCASEFVPPPLIEQLKTGGRMCIPVGPPFKVQHLILIRKNQAGELTTTIIGSVRFVPLVRQGG